MQRWEKINTLCHEILHTYVHPNFYKMNKGRRIITEGFTEILGDQLFAVIRKKANKSTKYRAQFEQGLSPNACKKVSIPAPTTDYGDDGKFADRIEGIVGKERFRAAYFLGQNTLAGLRRKAINDPIDDQYERQANAMADYMVNIK